MKKITLNDFSGGIQEMSAPVDFTNRQWAQLKGIVPRNARIFESQWPIQSIGTGTNNFVAVFPLVCEAGVYLVGIRDNGSTERGAIYWVKAPAHNDTYSTANGLTWTKITSLENYDWSAGSGTTQNKATLIENPEYRFICAVPVQAYKYARVPGDDKDNVEADTDATDQSSQFSGVFISTAEKSGSPLAKSTQSLIVYVDTNASPPTVKAVSFPNQRRIPTHMWRDVDGVKQSNFINGAFLTRANDVEIDTMPTWPFTPANANAYPMSMQPFTYSDIDGAVQAGRGIIPRANVGCVKGNRLLLGDIEWRKDFDFEPPTLDSRTIATLGTSSETTIAWPDDIPQTGRVVYNAGPGDVFLSDSTVTTRPGDQRSVIKRKRTQIGSGNTATVRLTLSAAPPAGIVTGTTTVRVNNVGANYNGAHTVTATSSLAPFYIEYEQTLTASDEKTLPEVSSSGKVVFFGLSGSGSYEVEVKAGFEAAVPNEWPQINAIASQANTTLQALTNRNLAFHFLNDNNTGPFRAGVYFAAGDLDEFDPRAVIPIGKSDIRVAGMHTIDDTVIIITTAGGEGDGVFRLRGNLGAAISYDPNIQSNPNAFRVELIKGGVGAPNRTTLTGGHKSYSCLWQAASAVVFIDRLGGVFYTDGRICDRLDRFGPKQPVVATIDDHVAAVGDHLFMYRSGRLLCFSMIASTGTGAEGCWTEIVAPSGTIKSMVGAREDLYFVNDGVVKRVATAGLDAERGRIDNVAQTLTVSTPTIASEDEHDRTTWEKFGMTYSTPTSCTVTTVRVQSTGALSAGPLNEDGSTDPVSHTTTLNRTLSNTNLLGEFVVPAGIGQQAMASATVNFTGYVRLESASFWITGRTPRRGDS